MSMPLGGRVPEPFSWAPIIDTEDDWVQIGADADSCVTWNQIHDAPPAWGEDGAGSELITQHVMCCLPHLTDAEEVAASLGDVGTIGISTTSTTTTTTTKATPDADQVLYQQIAQEYQPKWFDRSSGWTGESYVDALAFCASKQMIVCLYDAICPKGSNNLPYGGLRSEELAWAPVMDMVNEWVHVGADDQCILYSRMHPDSPDWGLVGGEEQLTRNIMCCKAGGGDHIANTGTASDATVSPHAPVVAATGEAAMEAYAAVQEKFQPVWFDRSSGWTGQVYLNGEGFCNAQKIANGDPMTLCPFEAYCPLGQSGDPFEGPRDGIDQWSPIMNSENLWVQVTSENGCVLYSALHGIDPEWGTNGKNNEAITQNVLCCSENAVGASSNSVPGAAATTTVTSETTVTATTTTVQTLAPTPAITERPTQEPTSLPVTNKPTKDELLDATFQKIEEKYKPEWYDRSMGWTSRTYNDAILFCAERGSFVPCPYEAFCPLGPGSRIFGGEFTFS